MHYGPTDRRTDGRRDEASYRDAWTHLKRPLGYKSNNNENDTQWSTYLHHTAESVSGPQPKSYWLGLVNDPTHPLSFVIIRPQLFEISCYIVVGPICQWWTITLEFFFNSRIRIRIFTKIEVIRPYHTSNMSTKFRTNPSTTFWDIVIYIVFGPISQWWRIILKCE